ncbi:MAG: dihydrodipicolinate reductase, partial [Pseudomonadota bacterium]
ADVVLHAPLPSLIAGSNPEQDLEDFCTLLAAGKNVITVVGYLYPKVHGADVVARLQAACQAGASSFHSTGLNPGWMGDILPLTISPLCARIDHVHVLEISRFDNYASPEIMFGAMGFNAYPEEYDARIAGQKRWLDALFSESVQMVADGLGFDVTKVRSTLTTALAETDLEVAAGTVRKGSVAGQHWHWSGLAGGEEVVAHETVWRIHPDAAPDWPEGNNWLRFRGDPNVNFEIERDFGFMDNGSIATAMQMVNAIPYVVAAEPGIQTPLDLPRILYQR